MELQPNINIERAILSSIIFDNYLLKDKLSDLKAADFLFDYNKTVFKAISKMEKEGKSIDENLLKSELEGQKKYNEFELLEILSATPISNVLDYKKKLKEISHAHYFKIKKAEIEARGLPPEEEIRELKKLFDRYTEANRGEDILNIVNSKNVKAETPNFFLKNIFPIQEKEITLISAGGGTGKSFIALFVAAKLVKYHDLKVFAFLSEDSVGVTKKRLEVIREANPDLVNTDIDYAGKDTLAQAILTRNKTGFEASEYFEKMKMLLRDYDVVILDPLVAFILEDENNNVEARKLFSLLNKWCEEENKTLIVIHHHSKEDKMRGASAFVDAVRIHYVIEKPKEDEDKNFRLAQIHKTNHFSGSGKFKIKLFPHPFEVTYEGFDVEEIEYVEDDVADVVDMPFFEEAEDASDVAFGALVEEKGEDTLEKVLQLIQKEKPKGYPPITIEEDEEEDEEIKTDIKELEGFTFE